jgi:hypothetical protein
MKICREAPDVVKLGQKYRSLYVYLPDSSTKYGYVVA